MEKTSATCPCGTSPPRVRTGWTEFFDQLAHMFYGLCLIVGFVYPVPPWGATILVMLVAILRELEQKKWEWQRIGRKDLFFFFLVCILFDAWYYRLSVSSWLINTYSSFIP